MYSLPFFGVTGGGQTLPIRSIYEYFNFTSLAIAINNPNKTPSANPVDCVFIISRSTLRNVTTTVNYQVVNVSNTLASDFVGGVFPSSTLVFAPGETTKTVTATIIGGTASGKIFAFELVNASDSDGGMITTSDRIECKYGEVPLALNAVLWLDASDATTISATNNLISQWRDKSGLNRHANQATGASQPSVVSSGISFAGAKFFNLDLSALTGAYSLFIVHNYTSSQLSILQNSSVVFSWSYLAQSGSGDTSISSGFGSPTYYKYDVLQSWTTRASVHNALINQTSIVASVNCTLSSFNRIGQGASGAGFGDNIYEIVVIPGIISTENRNLLTGYLAAKWALTANLPAGHPYKP